MTFKIAVFAAVVLTCQVNGQIGGILRPFAAGFNNGLNEMGKPFVQFGQSAMSPVGRPQLSQWMSYPSQIIPQGAYDGYEPITSGLPGVSYFQMLRPNPPPFKPQMQYYPISAQPPLVNPPRPFPAPAPEESEELYRPSTLLIQPDPAEADIPEPEVPFTLDSNVDIPTLQRPLPAVEDSE